MGLLLIWVAPFCQGAADHEDLGQKEHELHQLMEDVARAARAQGAPLKFGDLVAELAILEYSRRVPQARQAHGKFPEMRAAVKVAIP